MPILANGATIIIVSLLVLAIAYRYYSAFLAAKVLALDPSRPTPAHGSLKDGHNYHATNKWVLFGHHFAAISGAGPLIGPVLAAQFGYLPGLLWILIGVCLAGAVQDFIVLTFSMRRNGRSLAQIAYSEISTPAGTAATICILFVLVIALAGLGKVVTQALGGDTVKYPAGTQFIAPDHSSISTGTPSGSVIPYNLPKGTRIQYSPNARGETAVKVLPQAIELSSQGQGGTPVDISDSAVPPGRRLLEHAGTAVSQENGPSYPVGTEFYAPADKDIISQGLKDNIYHYLLPVGTTIVLRDQANKPIVTDREITLTAQAAKLALGKLPPRIGATAVLALSVPPGAEVVNEATNRVYAAESKFFSGNTLIQPLAAVNNLPRFTIPAGTRIFDATSGEESVSEAPFTLTIHPIDIMVTNSPGYRLIVPKDLVVTEDVPGSSWGTFTIALTIPIAFLIGVYLYRIRKNRVLEASIIGGVLTLGAVYLGGQLNADDSFLAPFRDWFNLRTEQVGYAMVIYGFIAGILPVWMLLCPRDYLSSFLKIGTIILLVIGVIVAHPALQAPAINRPFLSNGPVLGNAPIFPFVFITIMCGAISGFHSLVASGTTPKMIDKETDARPIGYGAMLMEGLVGIVALIAAAAMPISHYYDINTPAARVSAYQPQIDQLSKFNDAAEPIPDVGEHVQGRTGGAVTLAVGMADILNTAVNNVIGHPDKPPAWFGDLYKYWYHFAIMFEALFILTTIDTGTRVGRFLLQETMGRWISPKLGKTDSWPSAILATGLISVGWWYFLDSNAFDAIWAMFGIANQMLAVMALAVVSAVLVRVGQARYKWVTLGPLCFVAITTTSAAVLKVIDYAGVMAAADKSMHERINAVISTGCVAVIVLCTGMVVFGALKVVLRGGKESANAQTPVAV